MTGTGSGAAEANRIIGNLMVIDDARRQGASRWSALRFRALVVVTAVGLLFAAVPASVAALDLVRCRTVSIAVPLTSGGPANQTVIGDFCAPEGRQPSVLQLLVHGGTYDARYWDFPGFGGQYSYARAMASRGYATLAIDLLGVGRSSHPSSLLVTMEAQALAIHTVITASREGGLGAPFQTVVLVGHSLGTLTSYVEVAKYHDADGVVATGTSHAPGLVALAEIFARGRPALLDPATRAQVPGVDAGYLSFPGARTTFYSGGDVDPAVQAADEAMRQPDTATYLLTMAPDLITMSTLTESIDVPVLLANGAGDAVFCAQGGGGSSTDCSNAEALLRSEAGYFSAAARLETYVLPGSGHDMNLVPDAGLWFARVTDWFEEHLPA